MLVKIEETPEIYSQLIENLRAGRIVCLPTDTVYGFAVDGTNDKALKRLAEIKERKGKPFTFFISTSKI